MLRIEIGSIYLLHFARPVGNLANPRGQARHYLGWALDPAQRDAEHRAGRGAALTRAAAEQGIDWELFILTDGDRALERQIKQLKVAPQLCPICGRSHPRGRRHVPQSAWRQLELVLADPFDVPAPATRIDGYEIAHERAWRAARVRRFDLEGLVDNVGIPF